MKVQIYTLQSVDEAKKVASLGVDLVGVTPANIGLPGEITLEMGKDICASLTGTTTVAIDPVVTAIEKGWIENVGKN